jgi:hypothetical protein
MGNFCTDITIFIASEFFLMMYKQLLKIYQSTWRSSRAIPPLRVLKKI